MTTSKLSWMAVVALVATLNTTALIAADNTDSPDKPKPARKQGAGGDQARERVRDRIEQVAKELNLTEAQRAQLRPVFRKEAEKLKALRDDTSLTREQKREKMKSIREDFQKEVKPVLTAEQWEKWQKMRQERPQQRRQSPPQGTSQEKAK
jgi:protein CpxP